MKAEDEQDVKAASLLKAEQDAELAEFNESIPLDDEFSAVSKWLWRRKYWCSVNFILFTILVMRGFVFYFIHFLSIFGIHTIHAVVQSSDLFFGCVIGMFRSSKSLHLHTCLDRLTFFEYTAVVNSYRSSVSFVLVFLTTLNIASCPLWIRDWPAEKLPQSKPPQYNDLITFCNDELLSVRVSDLAWRNESSEQTVTNHPKKFARVFESWNYGESIAWKYRLSWKLYSQGWFCV